MIGMIDYGAGNLFSVANAFRVVGAEYRLVRSGDELAGCSKVVLPGVGHFGQMFEALESRGFLPALREIDVPLLGICLGMQALFESSLEAPGVAGLGLLNGVVSRLPEGCRVPHMGWNEVAFSDGSRDWFYFANSFVVRRTDAVWGETEYGVPFASAVRKGNVTGFQFHPEKSGAAGLELVRRWCENAG